MSTLALRYEGYFSDRVTLHLSALLETALIELNLDYRVRSRMKALLVEQIQNVQRYSSRSRQGTLVVGQEDDALFVETVNPIDEAAQQKLTKQLKGVADADKKTLQKRFREALRSPFAEDSQGAGMGLLFLAKKSSRRLDFHFLNSGGPDLCFQLKSYL